MQKWSFYLCLYIITLTSFSACKKDDPSANNNTNKLRFKLKFDPNQERLNELGQPSTLASGRAAQNPTFHGLSAHFIELVPNQFTSIGEGSIVYKGAETNAGGTNAIDFDQAIVKKEGEVFFELPISEVQAGTYEYIRVSVTYQNYDIYFNIKNIPLGTTTIDLNNQRGRLASFVGFNTYITDLTPESM
ncbi:MAG: hypothetical protein MK212_08085, partial [Saprospiraceae bacterium]|nr:hypothetical protein [Saprospiraceae bacterium]